MTTKYFNKIKMTTYQANKTYIKIMINIEKFQSNDK